MKLELKFYSGVAGLAILIAGNAFAQPASFDNSSASVEEATRALKQLEGASETNQKSKPEKAARPASSDPATASVEEAERALKQLKDGGSDTNQKQKTNKLANSGSSPAIVRKRLPPAPCNLSGNTNFFLIGNTGICAAIHGSATGFMGKDGATSDVAFTSQRLPSMRRGLDGKLMLSASTPMLYYYNNPLVANQTAQPYAGMDSMLNFLAFRDTDYGTVSAFVNARLYARTATDYSGTNRITLNQIEGNYWRGATDQAWVQFEGLRVGIQPSLFSFSRTGYTYMPGYQSYLNTPGVSYTKRFDNIFPSLVRNLGASLSVAVEDPRMRRYQDGVLARYNYTQYPDIVGQARIGTPAFLIHVSGAMHQIRDVAAYTYTGPSAQRNSTWGWAASVAGEYRWKWSNFFGKRAGETYGKAMVAVAGSQGALAYLGIPYMALDYVSDSYGALQRSSGQSLLASYEHLWTPLFKTAVTGAVFQTFMQSAPEDLGLMARLPAFGFSNQVRGQRVAGNAEYWMGDGWALGVDVGYTWTTVNGQYSMGGRGKPIVADFPNGMTYMRKAF